MIAHNSIVEQGCAKINLHLDITGRLEGGYHSVATVMQTVSLCDEITISEISMAKAPSFRISCNVKNVPCDERNLAYKAAVMFCEKTGINISANININKNIPMAAGMAGGSTDGAAVLRGLNRALGEPLSVGELCDIGSKLGADVPFCIVGGTAYADGKGDILHELSPMPECTFLVACEGEGVSTPWAYRLLDEKYADFSESSTYSPRNTEELKKALEEKNIGEVAANIINIFEEPVLEQRPVAKHIKELMLEGGAVNAMMSGSGPSVFGIYRCENCARKGAELLEAKGYKAYICRPV